MAVQDEVPKSRVTLTYKTEVNGETAVENLPFRLMVLGDFSGGSSKDRQVNLEERRVRSFDGNNTSDVMKDMGITLDLVVPNRVNPAAGQEMAVHLDVNAMNVFSPKEIATQVPQIRALLMLKQLLMELQANIANKRELGVLLNKIYGSEEGFNALKEQLKGFSMYQLPSEAHLPATSQDQKEEGNE